MTKISQSCINRKKREFSIYCKFTKHFQSNMIMSIFPTYVNIKLIIDCKSYSYCTTVKLHLFFYQTIVVNRPNHSEIGNIAKVIIHISFALSPCLIYLTSKNIILRESYKTFLATWRPSIFILCVNGFEYLVHDYSLDLLWRLMIPLFSRIQYFLNVKIVSEVLHRYAAYKQRITIYLNIWLSEIQFYPIVCTISAYFSSAVRFNYYVESVFILGVWVYILLEFS